MCVLLGGVDVSIPGQWKTYWEATENLQQELPPAGWLKIQEKINSKEKVWVRTFFGTKGKKQHQEKTWSGDHQAFDKSKGFVCWNKYRNQVHISDHSATKGTSWRTQRSPSRARLQRIWSHLRMSRSGGVAFKVVFLGDRLYEGLCLLSWFCFPGDFWFYSLLQVF